MKSLENNKSPKKNDITAEEGKTLKQEVCKLIKLIWEIYKL